MKRTKRTFRKRRRPRNKKLYRTKGAVTSYVSKGLNYLPERLFCRLKYTRNSTFTIANNTAAIQQMNLNSIYKPDETFTGHNPMGYTQLAGFYTKYRVWKTTYHIEFNKTSDRLQFAVCPHNNALVASTTPIDQTTFMSFTEMPRAIAHASGYVGGLPTIFRGKVYLPALMGYTKTEYIDDIVSATITTTPTQRAYLTAAWLNLSGGSVTSDYIINMTFYTELFDPAVIVAS